MADEPPRTGENDTLVPRTKTSIPPKRPLTKPIAPRTSTLTKPTSTSAAKTTTTGSSLSKPPARPTVSSARKPASTTTSSTSVPGHQKRISLSSVEGKPSGDEKKDGIAARPKRVSLAPSADRTASTKAASATPVRRTPTAPLSTRSSLASPTGARKVPSIPGARSAASTTSARSGPLSSSSVRNTGPLLEKKRLSTIPASPAVKTNTAESERLGEAQHGEDDQSQAEPSRSSDGPAGTARAGELEQELAESRAEVESLRSQLGELSAKMEDFSKEVEEDSANLQGAAEAIRDEHAAKIEHMSSVYQQQLENLATTHQTELDELRSTHRSELEKSRNDGSDIASAKDADLEELRSEVASLKTQLEAVPPPDPTPSPHHVQELADIRQQLQVAQSRHLAAKEVAKSKVSKLQEEMDTKFAEADAQHKEQIADLNEKLGRSEKEVMKKRSELEDISSEMSRQGQTITSLKDQIITFQQQKNDEANEKDVIIKKLEADLSFLQKSHADSATQAGKDLEVARTTHQQEIKGLKANLDAVQEELSNITNIHILKQSQLLKEHESALANHRSELESNKASHLEAVQTLQNDLRSTKEELAGSGKSNAEMTKQLQSRLDEAQQALEQSFAKQQKESEGFASRSSRLQEELTSLKAAHKADLQDYESQHKAAKEEAIATLEATHAKRIQLLEQDHKAALKGFDDIQANHSSELRRAKEESASSNEKALLKFKTDHDNHTRSLREELKGIQDEITSTKSSHLDQLKELEHKAKVDLEALKASHTEQTQSHGMRLQALQKDLESTKNQHIKRLSQVRTESAASQNQAMEDLKLSHKQQLEKLASESKIAHNSSLEDLRKAHSEQLRQVESQSKSALDELDAARFQVQSLKGILHSVEQESKEKENEHAVVVEKLEAEIGQSVQKLAQNSSRMMQLQTQYDQSLRELRSSLEADETASIESLTKHHETALLELRTKMESEKKAAVEKLQAEHDQASKSSVDSKADQAALVKNLQAEHQTKFEDFERELTLRHSGEMEQLQKQHASHLSTTTQQHETALAKARNDHAAIAAKLQAELDDARDWSQDVSEADELKAKLVSAQSLSQELENKHAAAVKSLKAGHESTLTQLRSEQKSTISKLQADVEKARKEVDQVKDASKHAKANTTLTDAQTKVRELNDQLQGALQEIETQRSLAESATSEVENLKKAQKQAELVTLRSPGQRRRSKSPKRKSPNGLETSRWATNENEPIVPAASSTAGTSLRGGSGAGAGVNSASSTPNDKKRNVAGQLAGIQEQINQLDDISDDLLEEHERMAKTLSKVAETTKANDDDEVD